MSKTLIFGAVVATLAAVTGTSFAQGRRGPDRSPAQGAEAPDFELRRLVDGAPSKETVKLSDFKGDRPVALVFGSYT